MAAILLSAAAPPIDLRDRLVEGGFTVVDHVLGSVPPLEFAPIAAALIDVGDKPDQAATQTKRWRAELGDDLVPIVWIVPTGDSRLTRQALDAGADAVLARPLDPAVVIAQVRSAARTRAGVQRVAARAGESRMLGEHLRRAHADMALTHAALRRVRLAFLQRVFPEYGPVRFTVCYRARGRSGDDFYEVIPISRNQIAFLVGDVTVPGIASTLVGDFAARIATREIGKSDSHRSLGDTLAEVNRRLVGLGLDDPPLIAMLLGVVHTGTGELALARAGLPAPVHLPSSGPPQAWTVPGPFLGTPDTVYSTHGATLRKGDKLIIGTDGIRPDGNPNQTEHDRLPELVERHRALSGQPFTDALARDLLGHIRHEDDFTLLVLEIAAGSV
jgi:phosphoserine phosphatase RsbU/P